MAIVAADPAPRRVVHPTPLLSSSLPSLEASPWSSPLYRAESKEADAEEDRERRKAERGKRQRQAQPDDARAEHPTSSAQPSTSSSSPPLARGWAPAPSPASSSSPPSQSSSAYSSPFISSRRPPLSFTASSLPAAAFPLTSPPSSSPSSASSSPFARPSQRQLRRSSASPPVTSPLGPSSAALRSPPPMSPLLLPSGGVASASRRPSTAPSHRTPAGSTPPIAAVASPPSSSSSSSAHHSRLSSFDLSSPMLSPAASPPLPPLQPPLHRLAGRAAAASSRKAAAQPPLSASSSAVTPAAAALPRPSAWRSSATQPSVVWQPSPSLPSAPPSCLSSLLWRALAARCHSFAGRLAWLFALLLAALALHLACAYLLAMSHLLPDPSHMTIAAAHGRYSAHSSSRSFTPLPSRTVHAHGVDEDEAGQPSHSAHARDDALLRQVVAEYQQHMAAHQLEEQKQRVISVKVAPLEPSANALVAASPEEPALSAPSPRRAYSPRPPADEVVDVAHKKDAGDAKQRPMHLVDAAW